MSDLISNEFLLLNNKEDNKTEQSIQNDIESSNYYDKFFKDCSNISEIDYELLIKEVNELNCCLNELLEKKIETPKDRFNLLEIRNKNIKIKLYTTTLLDKEIVICQYCKKHFSNPWIFKEAEFNFAETNVNICICGVENHDFYKNKIIYNILSDEIKKEIEDIQKLCEDYTIENKLIKVKSKILNLIKDKENGNKLKIISSLMSLTFVKQIFLQLGYDDEIYSVIFSCLKDNKKYSSYNNIMFEYMLNFFFHSISHEVIPILVFDFNYLGSLPALYYYNPDYFSYSFYFQIFRKKIISDNLESNKVMSFLKRKGITNDIICLHMMNYEILLNDLFFFGLFSLDSISKLNSKEFTKFKQNLSVSIIIITFIFKNQLYEIFFDFIKYGKSNRISLFDKSNLFSNLIIESILHSSSIFVNIKFQKPNIKILKNIMNDYFLFILNFLDEDKTRKIALLSYFSLSLFPHQNIFDCVEKKRKKNISDMNKQKEYFKEIFNIIDDEVNNIIKNKKIRKNDSLHNILIVKKLLDIYEIKFHYDDNDNFKIEELYYDFNELLQNIIEKDYPNILVDKVIQIFNTFNIDNQELNIYLGYLKKITLLCCTNIIGSSYIYNSDFIPKLLVIIQKLNFSDYTEIILDMLIFLKVTFNRKIIDISFLNMENKENEITLKEYLIDILFRNEPIISNNSMYDFSCFDRLLNRFNETYSFIFEKKNKKIFSKSFDDIKCDDSYLDIIKTISKNMIEDFNQLHWKNEIFQKTIYTTHEELIDKNEQKLEKIIKEKIKKINEKIPNLILLDILRCLENLNQTNFYLKYTDNSYFMDNKYDLDFIIIDDKIPFAVKSIILNFLLKYVLTLKLEVNDNKVYGPPLTYASRYEKETKQYVIDYIDKKRDFHKYLITLESKISEKHLNESVKLIYIYNLCIGILQKKKDTLNFKKAFIEKNGLYDFCVSIIQAVYSFSNLIINTNKIHEIYISSFLELTSNFFKNKDLFKYIISDETIISNEKINNKKLNSITGENVNSISYNYTKKISIINEINNIIGKIINKINLDSYNFSDSKPTSIYQNFNDYNNGKYIFTSDDHYQFIFMKKNAEITLEDLNKFNGNNNAETNSIIFNNYNEWEKNIFNEYLKADILLNKLLFFKNYSKVKIETFYTYIFIHLADFKSEGDCILNDHLFLKSLIKIIKNNPNFKDNNIDEEMKINIKSILNYDDLNEFKARIIGNIVRKIYFLTNYELLISRSFSNSKQENLLTDLLNTLILFLEILGENFNELFHEAFFKYKFDLSKEKNNSPVAKYDDESKTFQMLEINNEENNNIYTPYEILLKLHLKIFEALKIDNDDKYRETLQNNLLIIFNSLTYCIVEYTNFDNPDYKPFLENIYLGYFFWRKEDKTFNPIFYSINLEIDKNMIDKPKNSFIMNNILTLFIYYIKYGSKERNKNYFTESKSYFSYTPVIYSFHAFFYTSQIINSIDKNILNDEKNVIEKLIDLFKKRKIQNQQLFVIAKRYYELLFLSKTYYGFDILKSILPDNEDKPINSSKLIEYFTDHSIYSKSLIDFVIPNNNLDLFEKVSIIKDYSQQMNIIFLFWRKIFKSIEITIKEQNQIIYCINRPEIFYLLKDERTYYEDNIDYSSRESKLISMYDNIDSFIFEMIYNSNYETFNLANIFYYYGLELINIFFFIIENIILIIIFYKSWKEDYSKYNEIENNKTSNVIIILSAIHMLYIIIILLNWFINRLKVDYYYALTRNSNSIIKQKLQLSLIEKSLKFKRLLKNYNSDFKTINEFFPEFTDWNKRYILLINTIILNPKVYPFLLSLICLILQFVSKIFIVIPLLLIANLIPTLSAIFLGLFSKFKYLIFVYSYTFIVLYIFSWIGFLFLPHLFKFEVTNKSNEFIVDENADIVEEYTCSSSIPCILYFLNHGLSSGGALDLNLISFKNNYGYYLRQFFFEIFFFLFINMIFSNIFLALITDTFTEMREIAWKNESDKKNVCFICGLNQSDCIYLNKEFNIHIQEHSKWNYINFMCKLILEDDVDFNREEYYIWELIKKKNIDWFPKKQGNLLDDKEE